MLEKSVLHSTSIWHPVVFNVKAYRKMLTEVSRALMDEQSVSLCLTFSSLANTIPGQRQEIPVQHELFSSIVPPEQLFVPVPHPPPSGHSDNHPLLFYEATAHRHHREKNNPNLCHTHTYMYAVHLWAVTQQCWGCGVGIKSLGFPSISVRSPTVVRP